MDGFLIKTERTEKGPWKQHEQQRKRHNAIVLSDDDAKAPAPADKFPEQLEAYFVCTLCAMAYQWSTAPSRPSFSTGRVSSMESSSTSLVVATSKSQPHRKVTGTAAV